MYLYVPYKEDADALLENLPLALLKLTGNLEMVMELDLTLDRKLARVNATDVIAALREKGFYLQSPPNEIILKDDSMLHNPSDSF